MLSSSVTEDLPAPGEVAELTVVSTSLLIEAISIPPDSLPLVSASVAVVNPSSLTFCINVCILSSGITCSLPASPITASSAPLVVVPSACPFTLLNFSFIPSMPFTSKSPPVPNTLPAPFNSLPPKYPSPLPSDCLPSIPPEPGVLSKAPSFIPDATLLL